MHMGEGMGMGGFHWDVAFLFDWGMFLPVFSP